ncbi:MAG: alanine--glyoxylate aminotransferase family protein [Candidatus Bathyarchaeota archaeon]|nr:alanine--glyoxylate aminotransferase family protein [Candidatus Bathyarchaeota archaeon]
MKLFTVGPVACFPEVLEAMGMQMMSHRSKDYLKIHFETVEQLQGFIETKNPVFLFSSTGTGFMEASVLNCVKEKMIVCVNGSFGKRFAEVARANGREVKVIETKLGEPVQPEIIEKALEEMPDAEAVAITHNETSVGLINDLPKLTEVCSKHDKMVFVDAVSSMGGTELKADEWGIDICFSSSQKCFGVPPGIGIGSVSQRALDVSSTMKNKGWYFDLKVWEKNHTEGKGTPMTTIISQVAGMNVALKMIEEKGGKQWYFDLFKHRNLKIRKGIEKLGLSTYPRKGYESPTVSCISAPEGMSGPDVYNAVRKNGFELAQGYGALKETTFRIGNMGWIPDEYIDEMLETLGKVVS